MMNPFVGRHRPGSLTDIFMFYICSDYAIRAAMAISDESQERFGFDRNRVRRPRKPERLFFALLPDPEAAERIHRFGEAFACEQGLTGRRLSPERLHLSLHHVGDFGRLRPKVLFAAERAARTVSIRSFDLTLRTIGTFEARPSRGGRPPARPLVLLANEDRLLGLHRLLAGAMAANGLSPSPHIAPHITLSYGGDRVPMQPIEPIAFAVASFVLVHSERGRPRYTIIGRWALEAEPIRGSTPTGSKLSARAA
jgi:2'-5' RNA ligase